MRISILVTQPLQSDRVPVRHNNCGGRSDRRLRAVGCKEHDHERKELFDRSLKAAAAVWRSAGWQVRRVDCTASYVHFGSLRCLVNVLARGR